MVKKSNSKRSTNINKGVKNNKYFCGKDHDNLLILSRFLQNMSIDRVPLLTVIYKFGGL